MLTKLMAQFDIFLIPEKSEQEISTIFQWTILILRIWPMYTHIQKHIELAANQ